MVEALRLAREVEGNGGQRTFLAKALLDSVAAKDVAVLAEREACAELAESMDDAIERSDTAPGCLVAAAIRARSKPSDAAPSGKSIEWTRDAFGHDEFDHLARLAQQVHQDGGWPAVAKLIVDFHLDRSKL
jgi:hypothetical protein